MDPLIALTLALSLAALLGGSAVHQLAAWNEWPGVVRNYRLLPEVLVAPVAAAVPAGEMLTAAALLWSPVRSLGAVSAAALLLLFALALGINIVRGRTHIDCGCFGSRLRTGLSRWMVLRNLTLAGLAVTLLLPVTARSLSPFEVGASAVCVLTLAFLYPVLGVVLEPRAPEARAGRLELAPRRALR